MLAQAPVFSPPDPTFTGILPEVALVVTAFVVLLADAVYGRQLGSRIYMPWLATAGFGVATWLAVRTWGAGELQLGGAVAVDGFSVFAKVALAGFGLLTVWLAHEYLDRRGIEEAEFYALVMFAVAGMMLMTAAADLIVMFIALETFSLAIYVLVGFRRMTVPSQEASMKYFLLGAFSSAFFLLGIALAYGAAGSTRLFSPEIGDASITDFLTSTSAQGYGLMILAAGLLLVGLAFKVAAVPFHMWTPDAYQGAPSPVTGFMAAATKLTAFAALIRLFDVALFPLKWDWQPLVAGIAVVTMLVGSILAVVQEDVKRMLAYSSIAHAGFVLTGVIAANDRGVAGSLFYLATYGLIVVGAFAIVAVIAGRDEERVRLVDCKGLFFERPLLGGALTLFMLALAGVPLTSGFVAKVVVFGAAIEAGYWWLVAVGAVASAIAAFFYLRVLVVMYMQEQDAPRASAISLGPLATGVIGIAAAGTIVLGLYWGPLIDVAEEARIFFSAL